MNKWIKWAALAAVCLLLPSCAGMTAAETSGVVLTGAGALVSFVEALSPMLSPEQSAQLTVMAGNVQTVVQASTTALSQVAQSIADIKAQSAEVESGYLTTGEQTAIGGGLTAAGVGISRVLSAIKHKPAPAS